MLMKSIIKVGAGEKGIVPAPIEEELVGGRSTLLLGNPELGEDFRELTQAKYTMQIFCKFLFYIL